MKYLVCYILLCVVGTIYPLQTLNDLQSYAQARPEYPVASSQNWLDPDYTDFYKSSQPNILVRMLEYAGLYQFIGWNPKSFKQLLDSIISRRYLQKLSGNLVAHIIVPAGSRFIIWGDLHAAFHSLVQGLTDLYHQGIINSKLQLLKPNYYLVFNGDFINRSPYSVESLHIVLLLMKQNPDHIFYIRGKHEDDDYWHNFGLKRELIIRAKEVSDEPIPFAKSLQRFFSTLPHALYISTGNIPHHVIRISHSDRTSINEQELGSLFTESEVPLRYANIENVKSSPVPVDVKAIIRTENWMQDQISYYGLGTPEQELGANAWTILSSPVHVHQLYSNFYYDAYALLEIKQPIEQSTITLRHQHIKERTGFKNYATYNIATGSRVDLTDTQTLLKKPLSIGSSMPLVQGLPSLGLRLKQGVSVAINKHNQSKDSSYYIRTFIYNDNYVPSLARINVGKLLSQSIDILLLPLGSPTLENYLDILKEKKIVVFFPFTGATQFRNPELSNLVHLKATTADEVRALVKYMITERGVKKFAFFYQDDSYGLSPLRAAHEELSKYNITQWLDVPYTRGTIDLKEQAQKIKAAQPDVIGFFSVANPTLELIRQMGIEYIAHQQLFAISPLAEEAVRRFLKKSGLDMVFGSVVPNPHTSTLPIAQEYRQLMDAYFYNYDVYSFEGFIATALFLDACNHIKEPITKEKLLAYFESLNNYNFKGLRLTFNPKRRDLSMPVWIETEKDKEWQELHTE